MEVFDLSSKTRVIFGRGRENDIGQIVKDHGGRKVLLHYGISTALKSGLIERIKRSLDRVGIEFYELGGVEQNPKASKVYEGIDISRDKEVDFILAVGGSSVIDSAKAIAAGVFYDGDFWDIFKYKKTVYRSLPIGSILTMPAAGSERSCHAMITNDLADNIRKLHSFSQAYAPLFVILNPDLTATLKPQDEACVCVDMISHVLARYFSNSRDTPLTDMICECVLKSIIENLNTLFENPDNYDARANLMWAGVIAHSELYGAGRVQDWSVHIIERAISAQFDTVHGRGLAVIMPAYLEFVKNHNITRMAQFATRVLNIQCSYDNLELTATEGIAKFRRLLLGWSMPGSLTDLGIDNTYINQIVNRIDFEDKDTIGTYVPLSKLDCKAILTLATNIF